MNSHFQGIFYKCCHKNAKTQENEGPKGRKIERNGTQIYENWYSFFSSAFIKMQLFMLPTITLLTKYLWYLTFCSDINGTVKYFPVESKQLD